MLYIALDVCYYIIKNKENNSMKEEQTMKEMVKKNIRKYKIMEKHMELANW